MATKRVVPGSITEPYKKRQGDFSPDLIGQQSTGGNSIFTLGNFAITTGSNSASNNTFYNTGTFSDAYTLDTLDLSQYESDVLYSESKKVTLNLDPTNPTRFVYFGSFYEYIASTIKSILLKWKGSLYANIFIPDDEVLQIRNTVLSYSYDQVNNETFFKIPTSIVVNDHGLTYDTKFSDIDSDIIFFDDTDVTDISNLNTNYGKYQISNENGDYFVNGFTGSSTNDPYIKILVSGNPWPNLELVGFGSYRYHLRPKETVLETYFFKNLTEFENGLMNRKTIPKYTYSIEVPQKSEQGLISSTYKTITWPTSDGYNLDNVGFNFDIFLNNWLDATKLIDENKTDLIARRFISNSIIEFDTDGDGTDVYGGKVNKLLRIYGREFDEVKKYIDGLEFSRKITYNKVDNAPDELIKMLASEMGLDILLSFLDNNLFKNDLPENSTTEGDGTSISVPFSGYSRNLSPKEIDTELWRRLVVNAWWLFKSKGHRKVLEFFLNLFGIKSDIVSLDEYIYLSSKSPLDVDKTIDQVATYLDVDPNEVTISPVPNATIPMDEYGFPKVPSNTEDYYYQSNGFWYNGGNLSEVGNNPHLGPYDYGSSYINRLNCLIEGFNGLTTGTTTVVTIDNIFSDYNEGIIDGGGLDTFGENYAMIMNDNNRVSDSLSVLEAGSDSNITYDSSTESFRIKFSYNCTTTFCNDPTANNYQPDGLGEPCLDNSCCTYDNPPSNECITNIPVTRVVFDGCGPYDFNGTTSPNTPAYNQYYTPATGLFEIWLKVGNVTDVSLYDYEVLPQGSNPYGIVFSVEPDVLNEYIILSCQLPPQWGVGDYLTNPLPLTINSDCNFVDPYLSYDRFSIETKPNGGLVQNIGGISDYTYDDAINDTGYWDVIPVIIIKEKGTNVVLSQSCVNSPQYTPHFTTSPNFSKNPYILCFERGGNIDNSLYGDIESETGIIIDCPSCQSDVINGFIYKNDLNTTINLKLSIEGDGDVSLYYYDEFGWSFGNSASSFDLTETNIEIFPSISTEIPIKLFLGRYNGTVKACVEVLRNE